MKMKTLIDGLKTTSHFVKDHLTMILFLAMSNATWLMAFNASPVSLVILPILATSMLAISAIQLYQAYKEKNKRAGDWAPPIGTTIAAVLSNISIYGGILVLWAGISFAAGPWIFLAASCVSLLNQAMMLGVHAHRAYQSPTGSTQRIHHLQTMMQHAFMLALCLATVLAVVFVLLTPASPLVGTIFSLMVVSIVAAHLVWKYMPHEHKLKIKDFFGLGKPQQEHSLNNDHEAQNSLLPDSKPNHRLDRDAAVYSDKKQGNWFQFFTKESSPKSATTTCARGRYIGSELTNYQQTLI